MAEELNPIYYMRDDHTFKLLSGDVDTAIVEIEAEFNAGYTCGMLCSKRPGFKNIHAHGNENRFKFFAECKKALEPAPTAAPTPSQAPAVPSDERAAFEHFMSKRPLFTKWGASFRRGSDGSQYLDVRVQGHWVTWKAARAAMLTAAPTPPAQQPVEFEGRVIVGHSKHRGGWFVYEECVPGEYTPIKGPFASKEEADAAMRDPSALLIHPQPAVPESADNPPAQKGEWVSYNPLTATYDTLDGTSVTAELVENVQCLSDVLRIAQIRHKQRTTIATAVPEDVARVNQQMLEALEDLLDCPYHIDEATVSKAGLEATMNANQYQVVGNMSVALFRVRKARAAIAKARAAEKGGE